MIWKGSCFYEKHVTSCLMGLIILLYIKLKVKYFKLSFLKCGVQKKCSLKQVSLIQTEEVLGDLRDCKDWNSGIQEFLLTGECP